MSGPVEFNPYAAPASPVEAVPSEAESTQGPQPWSITDVFETGLEAYKRHWPMVLGTVVLGFAVIFGVELGSASLLGIDLRAPQAARAQSLMPVVSAVTGLAVLYVWLAWARLWVACVRDEAPGLSHLLVALLRYLAALAAFALTYVVTLIVMIPCVFALSFLRTEGPAAIIAVAMLVAVGVGFSFLPLPFVLADTRLGPVASLAASWRAMRGQRFAVLGFFSAAFVLNLCGAVLCGVGVLISAPVTFLAMAALYTRISGRLAPSAA